MAPILSFCIFYWTFDILFEILVKPDIDFLTKNAIGFLKINKRTYEVIWVDRGWLLRHKKKLFEIFFEL